MVICVHNTARVTVSLSWIMLPWEMTSYLRIHVLNTYVENKCKPTVLYRHTVHISMYLVEMLNVNP